MGLRTCMHVCIHDSHGIASRSISCLQLPMFYQDTTSCMHAMYISTCNNTSPFGSHFQCTMLRRFWTYSHSHGTAIIMVWNSHADEYIRIQLIAQHLLQRAIKQLLLCIHYSCGSILSCSTNLVGCPEVISAFKTDFMQHCNLIKTLVG